MEKFKLTTEHKGYINKADVTNTDPRFLIPGSQNIIINDGERVGKRQGYTLLGQADSSNFAIESSYDWITSTNVERNLRAYDGNLQVYYAGTWQNLATGLSSIAFNFAEWWSSSEVKDLLLFVDGTPNIYMWSGGITTFASATSNTITKQGTTTWAEDRFLIGGTRQVVIGGITYTYTGGEGTTTLTGVTPDPTAGGHSVGDVVFQAIRTTANSSTTGLPSAFKNSLIRVLDNYVYIGDKTRRDIYISKSTSYTDFSFTTPVRLPGEGALLTLDSSPVGFVVEDSAMYITGSKDDWYQTKIATSADLTKETLTIQKLKSGPGQGAFSQSSIGNIKNSVIYFSNERTVDTIGRVENIETPQSRPLSDPIKSELLAYDVTVPPVIKYYKSKTYIGFPSEGKVIVYDHTRRFWLPPWTMPVRAFAIIDGDLCIHSALTPETYKLFDGITDNGNPIQAVAAYAYRNFGRPDEEKSFDEYYIEGYISSGTRLNCILKYDFGGSTSIKEAVIDGSDTDILFSSSADGSLGKWPIGNQPLGSITDSPSDLPKFRAVYQTDKIDHYELAVVFETNDDTSEWEILRHGPNVALSTSINTQVKV